MSKPNGFIWIDSTLEHLHFSPFFFNEVEKIQLMRICVSQYRAWGTGKGKKSETWEREQIFLIV